MKKFTLAAASALTLALAVPMIAQAGGHKGGGNHLELLDTNGDATIARAEAEASAAAMFGKMDIDTDGFLTQSELQAGREAHRAEMKAERAGKREGNAPREPKAAADPARADARDARKAERGANMDAKAAERFAAVDADSDARWSTAEFTAHRLEYFTKFDADGDGNISADEQDAAKARMKERRGKWRDKHALQ